MEPLYTTTGNRRFAGRKMLCRKLFYRTPDKEFLCQRPEPETPGKVLLPANKPLPGAKLPAKSSRRQNNLVCRRPTPAKARPSAKVVSGVMTNGCHPSPRATPLDTRQRFFIFYYKKSLPGVSDLAPGKFFLSFFLFF